LLQEIRKRQGQKPTSSEFTDFDHVSSLLPGTYAGDEDDEPEWDEHIRELSIHLLQLFWVQVWGQLDSLEQEIQLLRNAPPSPTDRPQAGSEGDADAWRLDTPAPTKLLDDRGPLLDQSGKVIVEFVTSSFHFLGILQPLRPFTILPGGATDRARLQGEVFRSDHRLPTMSVDQYLEIERQRGNIITGGGWVLQPQLTDKTPV
jgi:immunoglobulin-binding protein 1